MKKELKKFDNWVNEEYLQSTKAEQYATGLGLNLKKVGTESELINGGPIESKLIDIVSEIEKLAGFQLLVTAGNDDFHKGLNSHHTKGDAIDFVFKNSEDNNKENRKKVEDVIISLIKSGKYNTDGKELGGINEYDKSSRHATGGHFHISLSKNNKEYDFTLNSVNSKSDVQSSDSPKKEVSIKSKFKKDKFRFFSRHFLKILTAKYDDSTGTFLLYQKGDSPFGSIKYVDGKVIVTRNNKDEDITSTKDGETFKNIFETKTAPSVPEAVKDVIGGSVLLKQGSTGPAVQEIQKKLIELGYLGGTATGAFDMTTKNAVITFQRDSNITTDGIVGPITSGKLYGVENNQEYMPSKPTSGSGVIQKATTDFDKVVATVIDRLEGGYYHPDMLKDGRVKDSRYSSSGETMMGIDRLAGGKLNDTPAGREFWKTIDDANARANWKWLYRGGPLESKLRQLAGQIIKPQFEKLAASYLTPEARGLVYSDGRLLFHFIYATWNGAGWFQKFANDINQAVASGIKDTDQLLNVAMDSRTKEGLRPGTPPNSLVAQGGEKIKNIVGLA